MKKAFIGALASLMLAGAISAVSGATTNRSSGMTAMVGEGTAPIPVAVPATEPSDGTSHCK
jgi:hypothetical protein